MRTVLKLLSKVEEDVHIRYEGTTSAEDSSYEKDFQLTAGDISLEAGTVGNEPVFLQCFLRRSHHIESSNVKKEPEATVSVTTSKRAMKPDPEVVVSVSNKRARTSSVKTEPDQ